MDKKKIHDEVRTKEATEAMREIKQVENLLEKERQEREAEK